MVPWLQGLRFQCRALFLQRLLNSEQTSVQYKKVLRAKRQYPYPLQELGKD